MNQMVKDKDKDNKDNNSSNSLVFGRWPRTKTGQQQDLFALAVCSLTSI